MTTTLSIQAINLYDTIHIKSVRSLLLGKVVDSSPQELNLQYRDDAYLFVYRFGCLVFIGLTNEEIERELGKIKSALGPGAANPTAESYEIRLGEGPTRVEFEYVEVKKLSLEILRLIGVSVAQSASLEYFELLTDRMLFDTSTFMENLKKIGAVPLQTKRLFKIIGSTASTRQNILSNLSILDPPDETWKSKELEKLHFELQQNFDVEVRFRTLDRKLSLIQDNIQLLGGLVNTRRSTLLETMIVVLIVLEIVLVLLHKA